MNKKQKWQLALAGLFAVLLIIWLFNPIKGYVRILGILSNALLLLVMLLSYRAEKRNNEK